MKTWIYFVSFPAATLLVQSCDPVAKTYTAATYIGVERISGKRWEIRVTGEEVFITAVLPDDTVEKFSGRLKPGELAGVFQLYPNRTGLKLFPGPSDISNPDSVGYRMQVSSASGGGTTIVIEVADIQCRDRIIDAIVKPAEVP